MHDSNHLLEVLAHSVRLHVTGKNRPATSPALPDSSTTRNGVMAQQNMRFSAYVGLPKPAQLPFSGALTGIVRQAIYHLC